MVFFFFTLVPPLGAEATQVPRRSGGSRWGYPVDRVPLAWACTPKLQRARDLVRFLNFLSTGYPNRDHQLGNISRLAHPVAASAWGAPPRGCCDASYQQEPPGAEKFRCNHFSRFEHEVCITSFNFFRQSQLNIFSPPPLLLAMLRRCSSCCRPGAPPPPLPEAIPPLPKLLLTLGVPC